MFLLPQAFLYIVYSRTQHVSLVTLVTCSDSSALHAISGLWSAFVDAARILLFYHLIFFCVHTKIVRTRVLLNTYSIAPCIPLFNRSLHSAGPLCGRCGRFLLSFCFLPNPHLPPGLFSPPMYCGRCLRLRDPRIRDFPDILHVCIYFVFCT